MELNKIIKVVSIIFQFCPNFAPPVSDCSGAKCSILKNDWFSQRTLTRYTNTRLRR